MALGKPPNRQTEPAHHIWLFYIYICYQILLTHKFVPKRFARRTLAIGNNSPELVVTKQNMLRTNTSLLLPVALPVSWRYLTQLKRLGALAAKNKPLPTQEAQAYIQIPQMIETTYSYCSTTAAADN